MENIKTPKKLVDLFNEPKKDKLDENKVINPKTNRLISKNGEVYKKLVKEGIIKGTDAIPPKTPKTPKKLKMPKTPKNIIENGKVYLKYEDIISGYFEKVILPKFEDFWKPPVEEMIRKVKKDKDYISKVYMEIYKNKSAYDSGFEEMSDYFVLAIPPKIEEEIRKKEPPKPTHPVYDMWDVNPFYYKKKYKKPKGMLYQLPQLNKSSQSYSPLKLKGRS